MTRQFAVDHPGHHYWTVDELEALPTLCVGQADNLKYDDGVWRVWLCRCGIADGMEYNNAVTIEYNDHGTWETTDQYEALRSKS